MQSNKKEKQKSQTDITTLNFKNGFVTCNKTGKELWLMPNAGKNTLVLIRTIKQSLVVLINAGYFKISFLHSATDAILLLTKTMYYAGLKS